MGSIVHRSVLKWLPTCAHTLFQDRFKDVQVGSRWFSTLYILSANFHTYRGPCQRWHKLPVQSMGSTFHWKSWSLSTNWVPDQHYHKTSNSTNTEERVGQAKGWKKQQSSMRKPGIPPARIPEITESSHSGMTFTLALWSKHRQRRVATKVVKNEQPVKQEVRHEKLTAATTAFRAHSESAQWFFSNPHHHEPLWCTCSASCF